jgi:hypothetical protein
MTKDTEYKGYNGSLILTATGVVIKRGRIKGQLGTGMLRGDKTIPYSSIVAVQLKKAGIFNGYIQLSIKGGSEAKKGLREANKDENTIVFVRPRKNAEFLEAKQLIEERMNQSSGSSNSSLNDLEKLAELKDKGVITQAEFDKKKAELLS